MTRATFDHELELLNDDLLKMGALIEQAIGQTIEAFAHQNYVLAREITKGDRAINDMEKAIEARCLSLILRQQPVAKDLRTVTTALKVITDMERIGDQAADIAELILRMEGVHLFKMVEHIPIMAKVAQFMVNEAVSVFTKQDVTAAQEIIKQDDIVDKLFNKVKMEVIEILRNSNTYSDICIDFLMIAKYFERIGDHAVNICEWVEFNQTGVLKDTKIL